jgi:hypothetical protein
MKKEAVVLLKEHLLYSLTERKKAPPTLAFPGEEPATRKGAFKVSSKALNLWKKETGKDMTPGDHLFQRVRTRVQNIPRADLPGAWNEDNIADTQDLIAMKPKKAFRFWLKYLRKVDKKLMIHLQRYPADIPLVYWMFMARVSGRDMADLIFKRYFETLSDHVGRRKG